MRSRGVRSYTRQASAILSCIIAVGTWSHSAAGMHLPIVADIVKKEVSDLFAAEGILIEQFPADIESRPSGLNVGPFNICHRILFFGMKCASGAEMSAGRCNNIIGECDGLLSQRETSDSTSHQYAHIIGRRLTGILEYKFGEGLRSIEIGNRRMIDENIGAQLSLSGFFSSSYEAPGGKPQEQSADSQNQSQECKGDRPRCSYSLWSPVNGPDPIDISVNIKHPFPAGPSTVGLVFAMVSTSIGLFFAWIFNR